MNFITLTIAGGGPVGINLDLVAGIFPVAAVPLPPEYWPVPIGAEPTATLRWHDGSDMAVAETFRDVMFRVYDRQRQQPEP